MIRVRRKAKVLVALAAICALALGVAAEAEAGPLQPPRGQVFFGVSDTGVSSQFNEFSELVGKHPAVIETFRAWGADLSGLDQTLAERRSAPDPPHLHRRPQRRARADHPAGDRPGLRRRLPDRAQPPLLCRRGFAPTSGRSESRTAASTSTPPMTAKATARPRAATLLVQAGLPPHLHPPARGRQGRKDRRPPRQGGAAAAAQLDRHAAGQPCHRRQSR